MAFLDACLRSKFSHDLFVNAKVVLVVSVVLEIIVVEVDHAIVGPLVHEVPGRLEL